jgi:tetratricopeptide (TPR) repeat protein
MNASHQQLDLSHKVNQCIQQQQWHPAKHHVQRLLRLDPQDAQAHQLMGLIHVQLANLSTSEDLRCEHHERAWLAFKAATQHGPHMFDAFLNLGNTCLQTRRYQEALAAFQSALALQPDSDLAYAHQAEAYAQLHDTNSALSSYGHALQLAPHKHSYLIKTGNLLRELNRHEDAVACYEQAIQMEPDHAQAYAHMAISLAELGHTQAALGACNIALDIAPQESIAHYHKALIELKRDDQSSALVSLNAALKIQPNSALVWLSKGVVLTKMQDHVAAIQAFDQAINLGIHSADIYQNRAHCHQQLKQSDLALDDLEKALALEPFHPEAMMALGILSQEMGRLEAALHLYTRVIERSPAKAEAYSNLGAVLFDLNRFQDSLETLKAAIEVAPTLVNAWNNLGATLSKLYRYEEAIEAYQQVHRLDPDNVDALAYQGLLLHDLRRFDEAMACYDRALSIDPAHSLSLWHRSIGLLLQGNFDQGWSAYEARWQHKPLKLQLRDFPQARWTGSASLQGQHVLVYAEQGLGDTLQFTRFLPLLVEAGARVTAEVHPPLKQLLARCFPQINFIGIGETLPEFDLHTPLLSIPAALKCQESHLAGKHHYLRASDLLRAEWAQRLGDKKQPRIGLVWSGNASHQNDRNRSIRFEDLIQALPIGFDYICLQNQIRPQDQDALRHSNRVLTFVEDLKNFEDTAALCHQMDLVITVDTSVAHLSAAMGLPTWTLIPHSPDWRWMTERTDTPWYSSMQLIRQSQAGTWQHELEALSSRLQAWSMAGIGNTSLQHEWATA